MMENKTVNRTDLEKTICNENSHCINNVYFIPPASFNIV